MFPIACFLFHCPCKCVQEYLWFIFLCRIAFPDSKVHGANMGPSWGRQVPGGPHVDPMNFDIWVALSTLSAIQYSNKQNGLIFKHIFLKSLCDENHNCPIFYQNNWFQNVISVCQIWQFRSGVYKLTQWGLNKMVAIFQTTFSNAFSLMKTLVSLLTFHWSLLLMVRLIITHYCFR